MSGEIKHLVMFSGGVCSWAAAKRVVERHGMDAMTMLFADTYIEDDDLYRFLVDATANIMGYKAEWVKPMVIPPVEQMEERKVYLDALKISGLTRISDGRTPWELMRGWGTNGLIANSRLGICSEVLKRKILDKWRNEHCKSDTTTIHVGLSWDENHRVTRMKAACAPWRYEAPMADAPFVGKDALFSWLASEGITKPRLYGMGFPHNNCGGFCVKAGQAHFAHLLRVNPKLYSWHETQEEELRTKVGNHSIMRDRSNGGSVPLTMKQLRERIQRQGDFDTFEWGGCGCAVE